MKYLTVKGVLARSDMRHDEGREGCIIETGRDINGI